VLVRIRLGDCGQDPLAWFAKYPGSFPLVHVKDAMSGSMDMTSVGNGSIDWKRIFAKRELAGIKHYFVEHDNAADGPGGAFASITSSYNYLSALTV
jgi:sugar phosphate isomerase/epimerase